MMALAHLAWWTLHLQWAPSWQSAQRLRLVQVPPLDPQLCWPRCLCALQLLA
jgi:hypothetical protein